MKANSPDLSVYVLTDRHLVGERPVADVVRAAIRGGATLVQLRDKHASDSEILALGRAVHQVTHAAGIPLIVNDRPEVALALKAEGLHIGRNDMDPGEARRLIGPQRLLGCSPQTVEEAQQAEELGADYLGIGDVYGTSSKPDADPPIGLQGLARMVQAVSIPVVAIGGITIDNTAATIQAGAAGVAVISAVMAADNPEEAARHLRAIVDEARQRSKQARQS
jgi:thiamine-phosphate pyrophosphorylase